MPHNPTNDKDLIERLQELLAKATPGPWGYDSRPGTACHVWVPATKLTMVDGDLAYKDSREDIADLRTGTREEDAALIVEAINALPTLLDRLSALTDEGWRLVPKVPTEAQWGGLARAIMMALDMNARTPREMFNHLERSGHEIPDWLRNEPEMQHLDHVPSKGTRCVLIYRAMLEAAPSPGSGS